MNSIVNRSFRVVSKDVCHEMLHNNLKVAIIIHLYYLDIVEQFYDYIKLIPDDIDLYIITSRIELSNKIKNDFFDHNNITVILKDNRGRDISALLVSGSKIVCNYDYICFLHDKKTISNKLKVDTDLWNKNLWDNLIHSKEYIYNIIRIFEENKKVGLVLPPERFGRYFHDWEYSEWNELDYKYANRILCMLGINSTISKDVPPISIGTMLWFKSDALIRLFEHDWKYEDFPDEPLPDDGTINHAIERIFPYIAHEAGYESVTVMSDEYAAILLKHSKEYSEKAFLLLNQSYGFINANDYIMADLMIEKVQAEIKNKKKVFLYGAGKEGKYCLRYLRTRGVEPEGFIVSCEKTERKVEGVNVYSVNELNCSLSNMCIIITVFDTKTKQEMKDLLSNFGVKEYLLWKSEG